MVARMEVHIMHRCAGPQVRLVANAWGVLTSNHAQSLRMAGSRPRIVNGEHLSRLIAASPSQLHFGLPETGGFAALSAKIRHSGGRDHRWSKPTPRHPDFRHKQSSAWVDSQLATWDGGMKTPPESVSASVPWKAAFGILDGHLEVGMCEKLCEHGRITDAVDALNLLVQRGCYVDKNLFYRVLKRCISHKYMAVGRHVHVLTVKSGYEGDAFLATHLIGLYAAHGRLEEAMRVFTKVTTPSSYNWAAIILAHARQGEAAEALRLYRQMRDSSTVKPTNHIHVAVLKACAAAGDLVTGKEVHAHILSSSGRPDIFVQTSLVDMYAKCRNLEDARRVFDRLPDRNVVTWTALIAGYAEQEMGQQALSLYDSMQQEGVTPNSVTFVCLLQACASLGVGALHQGKQLHAQIQERGLQDDVVVGGSLVNMYAKCGSLEDARNVFDRLPERTVVTWTTMIAGYAQQGMGEEALSLYSSIQQEGLISPNSTTVACLLQACASVGEGALHQGKQLHAQIEEQGFQIDLVLGTCLVDMYAKCGSIEDARSVFDSLPDKNVVTWTAMIAGYAQQEMGHEALTLYSSMQEEGITTPNSVTFVCLLQACAIIAALPLGKQLHAEIEERGLQADMAVGTALVSMYAKCGSMFDSQQVFDSLPERTVEAWGALLGGYARQGDCEVVFAMLESMTLEGIQPDGVTFLNLLTVCSHVGLVDKGRKYFEAMRTDYGISPTVEHYTSMMDLLGRAGHLDEALQLAKTMPFQPDMAVWLTLLGACRKWKNVEVGQQAFESAVSVDGKDAASYVLMSNIYASAQMWEEAKEMQARRVKSRAWKKPGQSWWTDMGGVVHTFVVGDKKHPESEGIYGRLEQLVPRMKKAGYVPHLDSSLRDISDDEKEAELCGHSEKLAIAYALNKTPEGTTVRIVKNLRVCVDCHTATAYISKIEKRTIICRDASRFHVFKEGKCSCGDYW